MGTEQGHHILNLLQTYTERLRELELQKAARGLNTPPEIISEIRQIRDEIHRIEADYTRQKEVRVAATIAFRKKEWDRAEPLLAEIFVAEPDDQDIYAKLNETRHQLFLNSIYLAACKECDEGDWQSASALLDELEHHQPRYPDPQRLHLWVEEFRLWDSDDDEFLDAWNNVVAKTEAALKHTPDDVTLQKLLARAHAGQQIAESIVEYHHQGTTKSRRAAKPAISYPSQRRLPKSNSSAL
jgi:hypothetical protein